MVWITIAALYCVVAGSWAGILINVVTRQKLRVSGQAVLIIGALWPMTIPAVLAIAVLGAVFGKNGNE